MLKVGQEGNKVCKLKEGASQCVITQEVDTVCDNTRSGINNRQRSNKLVASRIGTHSKCRLITISGL